MSYSSKDRRIANRRIAANMLLRGGRLYYNPIVEVDADGVICSVQCDDIASQSSGAHRDSSVMTEFYSGIMLAGFVNAHSHLELAYLRGAIEPGSGFAAFASKIGAVRDQFTREERLLAMERAVVEMEREGIVAVGDIVNGETSYEVKGRAGAGISYRNFAELFGLRTHDMNAIEALLRHPNTEATPHSLYSLNDPILREVAHFGDWSKPLSIHFMESESEQQLFDRKGALYNWYERVGFECDFLDYASPAERLVSLVPSGRSVILVHNCCVTQRDIDIVMSHFTAPVYWTVCPRSNEYISGVRPPLDLLRKSNLNICVGTDSLASNWSLSIVEELRLMADVPLVERLDWATRIGAAALGFDYLGDIEQGRRPRINILSGLDYDTMQLTDRVKLRRVL